MNGKMKALIVRRLLCFLLSASDALAQSVPDARTQFAQLLKQVKEARQKNDEKAVLAASLTLARLLHYSEPATEQVAIAYAEMGDQEQALRALRDFARMGQCDDKLSSRPQFHSLKSSLDFKQLLEQMQANKSAIERGVEVAKFADANLPPEDLDYDAETKTFLVTSILEKKIVRIGTDGVQRDFASAPDGWPMLAVKIDAQRGIVWATEVALNNFTMVPSKD
jgi:hypothetical protein